MQTTQWLIHRSLRTSLCHTRHASLRCRTYHVLPQSTLTTTPKQSRTSDSLYIDTIPPTPNELLAAKKFFEIHIPTKSWTAEEWRKTGATNPSSQLIPEVVFLGRSNTGKSSLLNALLNDQTLNRVSARPGKTMVMHAWSLAAIDPTTKGKRKGFDSSPKLNILDTPGFGHGSHSEWGEQIMKYLSSRRQLRRAFVLVNPLHGLKESDMQVLGLLKQQQIPHQVVACKCDALSRSEALERAFQDVSAQIEKKFGRSKRPMLMTTNDILAVGGLGDNKQNKKVDVRKMRGVQDVQWAVLKATGLEEYALSLLPGYVGSKLRTEDAQSSAAVEKPKGSESVHVAFSGPQVKTATPMEAAERGAQSDVGRAGETATAQPKIGIGIEELMAMTMPSKAVETKPSTMSRFPPDTLRTRRQRIAASRNR